MTGLARSLSRGTEATDAVAATTLRLLMLYEDTKVAYGDTWSGVDLLPPNFYEACARHVFPGWKIECDTLPDVRRSTAFRWLTRLGVRRSWALVASQVLWVARRRRDYDVILGWHGTGVALALLRWLLRARRPRLGLVLYRLYNPTGRRRVVRLKRWLMRRASPGCDLLLTVSRRQARIFADELRRPAGATVSFRYGVDTGFFRSVRSRSAGHPVNGKSIVVPGGAHRDDATLVAAVGGLDIQVNRFKLTGGERDEEVARTCGEAKRLGTDVSVVFNAPFERYAAACSEAAAVVISVHNDTNASGLTSLLEAMVLGRPAIITRGLFTSDYVEDGVTGFECAPRDPEALRRLLQRLFDDPATAARVGEAARAFVERELNLEKTGGDLAQLLWRLHRGTNGA